MKAKITYRGWAGHFICAHECQFRLNTLVEFGEIRIVVSTVGAMLINDKINIIGHNRYYETMAFHACKNGEFWDADVSREVSFSSRSCYSSAIDEWTANKGHIAVVEEIARGLEQATCHKAAPKMRAIADRARIAIDEARKETGGA